jgi:hypothetical protein
MLQACDSLPKRLLAHSQSSFVLGIFDFAGGRQLTFDLFVDSNIYGKTLSQMILKGQMWWPWGLLF